MCLKLLFSINFSVSFNAKTTDDVFIIKKRHADATDIQQIRKKYIHLKSSPSDILVVYALCVQCHKANCNFIGSFRISNRIKYEQNQDL